MPKATAAPTAVELREATRLLEAIGADRTLLADLTLEERQALLVAAGRVVHADLDQKRRLVRTLRRHQRRRREEADRKVRAGAGIRVARETPVFVAPAPALPAGETPAGPELESAKSCYVCKAEFRRLHFFYDALCPDCAALNYEKRFQTVPLSGRVGVVTGARVKIGYHIALKLLRAGATVIATTRFPHDAARRYAAEPDFGDWGGRLRIHGLDLRHAPSVELFCRYLVADLDRLDVLVNNACQTVRRPPGFYTHLVEQEGAALDALPAPVRPLLAAHHDLVGRLHGPRLEAGVSALAAAGWEGRGGALGLAASARLSQVRFDFDDAARERELFPEGRLDADLQQVDLRATNSWRLTLADVPIPEMMEVQLVNAVAPFVLCSRLKPLFQRGPERDRHIVNVSAMEGVFSRGTKTDRHPHTNMAKAALNMLTLTSARDYVKDGIHMNAVDTGWITDEDPHAHASRKKDELDFQPPLDVVDGAARVLDPFVDGLRTGAHLWGKFLKDYKISPW